MKHKNWIPIADEEELVKLMEILYSFDGWKTGIVCEVLDENGAEIKVKPIKKSLELILKS
jgi:hypothetical protein